MIPIDGLFLDAVGSLYGVTRQGGLYGPQNGYGTVFKLDAAGKEVVVHSFGKGKDGNDPSGVLLQDAKGNLYGATGGGGRYGYARCLELDRAAGRPYCITSPARMEQCPWLA